MTPNLFSFLARTCPRLSLALLLLVMSPRGFGAATDNDHTPAITGSTPASLTVVEGHQRILGKVLATDTDIRDTQIQAAQLGASGQPLSTLFRTNDIYNLAGLTDRLKNASNDAARFVTNKILSLQTYTNVINYTAASTVTEATDLLNALTSEINAYISDDAKEPVPTNSVPTAMLTLRTKELIGMEPTAGESRQRLSRRLLQDALPEGLVNYVTFTIESGNSALGVPGAPFFLDPDTGEISSTTSLLDFENPNHKTFTLQVSVSDSRGRSSGPTPITITVQNTNEPPVVEYKSYELDVNSGANTVIGAIAVTDPDANSTLSYSIESGDRQAGFEIKSDGNLYLKDPAIAALASNPITTLTIKVTDPGGLSDTGTLDVFARNPEVPSGSPLMARIPGSALPTGTAAPEPAAIQVASGAQGEVYVLGLSQGEPFLTVYPGDFSSVTRIKLFDAANTKLPKFTPKAMAAAGDHIFVVGDRANGDPQLMRVTVSSRTLHPCDNTSILSSTRSIAAVAVQPGAANPDVYVSGTVANGGTRDHYWARLDFTMVTLQTEKKWGWPTSVSVAGDGKQKFSGVIGVSPYSVNTSQAGRDQVTALTVDGNGGVYVAGYWTDGGARLMNLLNQTFGRTDIYDSPWFQVHIYGEFITKRWLGNHLPLNRFIQGNLSRSVVGESTVSFGAIHKPEVAYIAKFDASGNHTQYAQDFGYETKSRVRDLKVVTSSRGTFLYTVQEYSGRGGLGGEAQSPGFSAGAEGSLYTDVESSHPNNAGFVTEGGTLPANKSIKINRFTSDLRVASPQNASIGVTSWTPSSGSISAQSLSVDRVGNISIAGLLPIDSVSFRQPSGTGFQSGGGVSKIFSARLDTSFNWQEPAFKLLGTEPYEAFAPVVTHYLAERNVSALAGNLKTGRMALSNEQDPSSSTPPAENFVAAPQNATVGFLAFIDGAGNYMEQHILEIESAVGNSVIHISPWKGRQTAEIGATYTVEVPREIYVDAAGQYLGSLSTVSEADKRKAVTRYISKGYTVADTEIIGDSTAYTFVFKRDTKITFHWQVEHAVEVASDLSGTGASWFKAGSSQSAAWTLGDEGEWRKTAAHGLTSLAAGNPQPEVKKHWVAENQVFTAFIDGTAADATATGVRYKATGYRSSGAAPSLATPWIEQPRQQVPQFVVSAPARIIYEWKPQFRILVSTSRSKSKDLPQVRVAPDFNEPAAGQPGFGSGEHWFDKGTGIRVGGKSGGTAGQLRGWLFADGAPFTATTGTSADLTTSGDFSYLAGTSIEATGTNTGLQNSVLVTWDYGAAIFRVPVTIGSALDPSNSGVTGVPTAANYRISQAPTVTAVQSPSGSTGADMHVWDILTRHSLPVRPGKFLLEFLHNTDPDGTDPLVFEVTSSFPVQPHYRHVAHPEMPGVLLDADPKDAHYFQALKYSEGNAGSVIEGRFFAQGEGRHVLLYSAAATAPIATGDLNFESNIVRVVESRLWNSTPANGGLGAWTNIITSDPITGTRAATPPAAALLADTAAAAEIGQRLDGSSFDRAGRKTGFVVSGQARYNPDIYDRAQPEGPIIPVNRQFTTSLEDQLVVVWYETARDAATRPANMHWPWQSVNHTNVVWPVNPGRIVIASRLGSEGQDAIGQDQPVFSPDTFESVRIYHQPNPALPGFNPNEEHALIAPSFKFLSEANPPPAAYALRDGDLNIVTENSDYTSEPFVLVEYFDIEEDEFKMAVYKIEREDPTFTRSSPYRYPEQDPNPDVDGDQREFPYVFDYTMEVGEPVQPPYPLGVVIGLTRCQATHGENGNAAFNSYWEDYTAQPWAISDGRLFGYFYYPLLPDFWHGTGAEATAPGTCIPFLPPPVAPPTTLPELTMTGEKSAPVFAAGSKFDITPAGGTALSITIEAGGGAAFVKAVTNLNHANLTARLRSDEGVVLVWKGTADPITLTDGTGDPLAKAGIYTGPRSRSAFTIIGSVVLDSSPDAVIRANSTFRLNGRLLTLTGTNSNGTVNLSEIVTTINTSSIPNISASALLSGELRIQSANGSTITLEDGVGSPLLALGLQESEHAPSSGVDAQPVAYRAIWPTSVPILKLGETLTYAGGEFRADNPTAPGLPGVVGWAAGEVLFDSLNPSGSSDWALQGRYGARLISPLETVAIELPGPVAQELKETLAPATGLTEVDGTVWTFTGLPASLGKRIYFDPLNNELGLLGFLNDLTLGDSTLTATPPPVYVLEPNILTPSERDVLLNLAGAKAIVGWAAAIQELYALSRNPEQLHRPGESKQGGFYAGYNVGLTEDIRRDDNGDPVLDARGNEISLGPETARQRPALGPGLALVPGPALLDPQIPFVRGYITLVENNNEDIGGPVSLFVIKLEKKHRYRGAIKTILSDNVFDEKINLRHTGDFGGNADDLVYQWFYREENGSIAPLPPASPWRLFIDQSNNEVKGLGQSQIGLEGTGGLLLADNLFFVRYRHMHDAPAGNPNSVDWSGLEWEEFGQPAAVLDRAGNPVRGEDGRILQALAGEWAGAANSPSVDGVYVPQLAMGWIKRVLDRVNPYEARFNDFRSTSVPATYASMILQLGQRFEGSVALNADKDVIENVGLIELYETVLNRGMELSINLSSPISTPGINNALLLAATRLSDFYMLLGHEAFADAQDPTIGFGSDSADFGSASGSMFSFQNQLPSLLDEELALLRGIPESYRRPVYNRLFWNFTKGQGEVAYALNYNISDQNLDGFVDELDAMILFPQGHGDAWGHYTTALHAHYRLLRHPFFNWASRAERYNLIDVAIDVDFLDERRFAEAAAARARAGAEIVDLTYRSRYVADPGGQWQGYTDSDPDRAWGVQEWARRAGQGALFDWVTANALIPAEDPANRSVVNEALKKIDRETVTSIKTVASNLRHIQEIYNQANSGLNPLGLSDETVLFDVSPEHIDDRVFGGTHFEQIYGRAERALANALTVFESADQHKARIRGQQNAADSIFDETYERDRDLRNRLIEIFGTPYEGTIGTGRPYPAGYAGPDLLFFMYVDENDFTTGVPRAFTPADGTGNFELAFKGLKTVVNSISGGTAIALPDFPFFLIDATGQFGGKGTNALPDLTTITSIAPPAQDGNLLLNLPVTADGYSFKRLPDWGRRGAPGELQTLISEMLQAENALAQQLGNYDNYLKELQDKVDLLEAKYGLISETLRLKYANAAQTTTLNGVIQALEIANRVLKTSEKVVRKTLESVDKAVPDNLPPFGNPAKPVVAVAFLASSIVVEQVHDNAMSVIEQTISGINFAKETASMFLDLEIEKEGYKFEIREQLKEIEQHLRNEGTMRMEILALQEALREVSNRYRSTLARGIALLDEREDFNAGTAVTIQRVRYQDMAFRVFRNDAIQKYRAAFDLAARYAFLAARAYDYETNFDPSDPASAETILEEIIAERTLGAMGADGAAHIHGLSSILAKLRDNYQVLKGRLGINNPQAETGKFSLRQEFFRIKNTTAGNAEWVQVLNQARKANLWDVPEFVRHCRPFAPRSAGPEPGLVIEFPTQILARHNFFGKTLAGGDNAFDSSLFATKIRSVGVWFAQYPNAALSATPRVYLVPAGSDVMIVPNSRQLETRAWQVVDQSIPIPFPVRQVDLANLEWIPVIDSLSGPMAAIRRFSSFRAFGDVDPDVVDEEQLTYDTRLVGRSVWNTRWLLIIPGSSLAFVPKDGLDEFIASVSDIKLYFQTYGYSGN